MDIEDTYKTFKEISEVSSRSEKEKILAEHKSDTVFRELLNVVYNPFVKTNIAKKKMKKKVDSSKSEKQIKDLVEFLNYLKDGGGTDSKIATIQSFIDKISNGSEYVKEFLESVATQSLKIGVTSKTINKVFDEQFIPEFGVMLAEPYIAHKRKAFEIVTVLNFEKLIGKKIIITQKLDGNRMVAIKDNGKVKFYSRSGKEIEGLRDLEMAMKHLPDGYAYDGEVIAENPNELNSNELFKVTSSIMRKKGLKTGLEYHMFDMVPLKEFMRGVSYSGTFWRKTQLEDTIGVYYENHGRNLLFNVPMRYCGVFDEDLVKAFSKSATEDGEEGIMVQLADAPYVCKRTTDILKLKEFMTCDIRVLDVYEGINGENIGRLGGVIADFKGSKVKVGGGFSREQRIEYWKHPEKIIGKIIEVKYFEEFISENGELDLRFADFKTIREDKDEPSYH